VRGRIYGPATLHPRKEQLTAVRYESGWPPTRIRTFRRRGNSLAPPGNRNLGRPARSLVITHLPTTKWRTLEYYQPNNSLATWGKIATESTVQLFQLLLARTHAQTHIRIVLYRWPTRGSFFSQKACIRRDILWQLPCSGQR